MQSVSDSSLVTSASDGAVSSNLSQVGRISSILEDTYLCWTDLEQKLVKDFYNLQDFSQDQWIEDELKEEAKEAPEVVSKSSTIEFIRDRAIKSKSHLGPRSTTAISSYAQQSDLASYYGVSLTSGMIALDEDQHNDPLGLKGNISKHLVITGREEDEDLFDAVLISSKSFDPVTFLKTLHKNTSFQGIEKGLENLQESLGENLESMKNLVKQNFERFVNAKIVIDGLYEVLKKKIFEKPEIGLSGLLACIENWKEALNASLEPLLAVKNESDALSKKLRVIQQFRFLFQLSNTLKTAIRMNQVDTAISDYRKGKSMITSAFHQSQGQATFHRLWKCIEESAGQMKSSLFERLDDPESGIDKVEKYIVCLLEMDLSQEDRPDPVMYYVQAQEKRIMKALDMIDEEFLEKISAPIQPPTPYSKDNILYVTFVDQLNILLSYPMTEDYCESPSLHLWESKDIMIDSLCDLMSQVITPFWSWSLSVINGKYSSTYSNEFLMRDMSNAFDRITKRYSSCLLGISKYAITSMEEYIHKGDHRWNTSRNKYADCMTWNILMSGRSICNTLILAFSSVWIAEYPGSEQLYDCLFDINRSTLNSLIAKVQDDMSVFSQLLSSFHQEILQSKSKGNSMKIGTGGRDEVYKHMAASRFTSSSCSFATRAFCIWSQRILQECYELTNLTSGHGEGLGKDVKRMLEDRRFSGSDRHKELFGDIRTLSTAHWKGYLQCISSIIQSIITENVQKEPLCQSLISIIKDIDWLKEHLEKVNQTFTASQISIDYSDIKELLLSIETYTYVRLVKLLGEKFVSLISQNFEALKLSSSTLIPSEIRGYVFEILIDVARLRFEMEGVLNREEGELLTKKLDFLLFHEMKDRLMEMEHLGISGFIQIYMELHFFHSVLFSSNEVQPESLKAEQQGLWNDITAILERLRLRLSGGAGQNTATASGHKTEGAISTVHKGGAILLNDETLDVAMAVVNNSLNQCLYLSNVFK